MIVYDSGLNILYTDVRDARIDICQDSQSRKVYTLTFADAGGKIYSVFITGDGEGNCVFINDERYGYDEIRTGETRFVALLENENNAAAIDSLPG